MNQTSLTILILAAGKGTRMKSDLPKVMHPLAGRPMINWLIETCESLNPDRIITVIGPDMPELAAAISPHESVVQQVRDGTAGAVRAALPALKHITGKVLIVMGDEPLVEKETLQALIAQDGLAVQGFHTNTPFGLGRMVMNEDGSLLEIVEEKDASDAQKLITLCNAGNYCIPAENLSDWVNRIDNNNVQGEYYLTDIPKIAAQDGVKTHVVQSNWQGAWGVNDREQLAQHETKLQKILRTKHMRNGVTMVDPDTVYLWHDTQIGENTIFERNIVCGRGVKIADNVTIKAFTHLEDSQIASGAAIGPFARLRGNNVLAKNTKIGNFVELKNAKLEEGVKASHLTYLGDAIIGADTNIGAGTITCNYDGFGKHQTIIGSNVFVGSNSALVAPISIGDGAIIAAGSTITQDIPPDSLAISRAPLDIREGSAVKYREVKVKNICAKPH